MSDAEPQAIRTRSEYRLGPPLEPGLADATPTGRPVVTFRRVEDADRERCAEVLLAAYRGTIDDEGETAADALAAMDHYLGVIDRPHSLVAFDGDAMVGFAFVVHVGGRPFVDPIVTVPDRKRTGLGRAVVAAVLDSLAAAGASEVGATITDGNTAFERLFASLGFRRVGPWPPAA